jgi:hypothetical protein
VSLFIKICGIADHQVAQTAVSTGADAVGFVFATSPRQVTPRQALSIAGELPPAILRVAVFRRPEAAEIEAVLEEFTPDLVQADHQTLDGFTATATLPVFREGGLHVPDGGRFLYEGRPAGRATPSIGGGLRRWRGSAKWCWPEGCDPTMWDALSQR